MDETGETHDDTASLDSHASGSGRTDGVDTVLFDLDGTVCEYERSPGAVLTTAFERADVEPFFEVTAYYDRFETFVDESDDIRTLRERCFADIAHERGRNPAVGRAVADAFAAERDHSRVAFVDGARTVLTHLSEQGYRLGLVTNGPPGTQQTKLNSLGVTDRFDAVVFAGHETPSKPHPRPFVRALDSLGAQAERALFVGDSLESDIVGARSVGMQTAWVAGGDTDPGERCAVRPGFVLESTGEVRAALSEMSLSPGQ